jgi:hypothetical protein
VGLSKPVPAGCGGIGAGREEGISRRHVCSGRIRGGWSWYILCHRGLLAPVLCKKPGRGWVAQLPVHGRGRIRRPPEGAAAHGGGVRHELRNLGLRCAVLRRRRLRSCLAISVSRGAKIGRGEKKSGEQVIAGCYRDGRGKRSDDVREAVEMDRLWRAKSRPPHSLTGRRHQAASPACGPWAEIWGRGAGRLRSRALLAAWVGLPLKRACSGTARRIINRVESEWSKKQAMQQITVHSTQYTGEGRRAKEDNSTSITHSVPLALTMTLQLREATHMRGMYVQRV